MNNGHPLKEYNYDVVIKMPVYNQLCDLLQKTIDIQAETQMELKTLGEGFLYTRDNRAVKVDTKLLTQGMEYILRAFNLLQEYGGVKS